MTPGLEVRVGLRLGTFALDVELTIDRRQTVAVVGPNGAGKTTLLRALAGLLRLERGRIAIDGTVMDTPPRVWVPPEQRPVGMVFQDYLLFPHLTALDNVAFGLRSRGTRKTAARAAARTWLDRVGVAEHAASKPRALSGGQAQRVALARALITEPTLLLLDEPLSAIDVGARAEVRTMLRRLLHDHPGVSLVVTHDPLEAAALADLIVVLEAGTLVQVGTVGEVTARPRSAWVARMVGLNYFRGVADGSQVRVDGLGVELTTATPAHGPVITVIHPHAVALHRARPETSARNVYLGTVESMEAGHGRVRVSTTGPLPLTAEVTAAAVSDLRLADGGPIWVSVKATEVEAYPI